MSVLKGNRRNAGQGMTEYILIVALIAILSITVVTIFGNQIRALFAGSAQKLTNDSATVEDVSGSADATNNASIEDLK
ncbi:MAG: hypothetical protein HY608_11060 [Planctomycetes bacterium]|nr:hypothetical protein [Planctomycetota bacterium]